MAAYIKKKGVTIMCCNYSFFDLHRHDKYSYGDACGEPFSIVERAKELHYTSLGISNHGNVDSIAATHEACIAAGIKPILGCEVYFQPDRKDDSTKTYHLCLFCKNKIGYENLLKIVDDSKSCMKKGKGVVDFSLLDKFHDGIICTTACICSSISQSILHGHTQAAIRMIKRFKNIFGDDFYIEIQPYDADKKGTQRRINAVLLDIAAKTHVKCIITSDSHFCNKKDFNQYRSMHKMSPDIEKLYSKRYMPSDDDINKSFLSMMYGRVRNERKVYDMLVKNLNCLSESVTIYDIK